jgi:hypothetical protein
LVQGSCIQTSLEPGISLVESLGFWVFLPLALAINTRTGAGLGCAGGLAILKPGSVNASTLRPFLVNVSNKFCDSYESYQV